ncbi:MAG: 3-hydroxyacyl-CoA dehydrogenase [Hyphomicrobiales bacterium]|nr:3-hydroxyacyl-CoA dehydrogenase [Hyphomicrobiales bacterium]
MSAVSITCHENIAIVQVDNPPVNALSHEVRSGLMEAAISLDENPDISVVILICKGRTFIAGADIREFGKPVVDPHLPDVINRIEASRKPWIAAIHGTVLGGGLEVALGCHYRVALASAKFGFPEVNLGLIPGAGGTVRLPRLINTTEAVKIISDGRPLSASKAANLGVFNQVFGADTAIDNLLEKTIEFAKSVSDDDLPEPISARTPVDQPSQEEWDQILTDMTKKARGQNSPVEAALAVRQSCEHDWQEGQKLERERFIKLRDGDQSKALRYVFFAQRQTAKIDRLQNTTPLPSRICGILGGGTMGAGICAAMLLAGKHAVMVELDKDALDAGMNRVTSILQASLKREIIDEAAFDKMQTAFTGSIEYQAFSECDIIVEAVFEDMAVKRQVFSNLDAVAKPDAVLASNTSYLDVNEIAASVKDPSRVLGLHFFSPAHIMKLVEVIATDAVSDQTLSTGFAFAKSLGKTPVLSGVCEGFIANRILSAYRKECDYMLEDGATPKQIDGAMREFGLPMGLFEMADLAGLDIGWATRKRLAATRDPNERYVSIADRLCELGRFGQKTGKGWYIYEKGSRAGIDDQLVQKIIEEESAKKDISRRQFTAEEIMDRIIGAMTREAGALLEEGIAERGSDIDMAMILGFGFPRWRGGPVFISENTN